jgi:hypothetical protein
MRIIKYTLIATLLLTINSCIDRYYLDNIIDGSKKIVIDGAITDNCNEQIIRISYTSSTENPVFKNISNCVVKVVDLKNNTFEFKEDSNNPGNYKGIISEEYLIIGNKFQLNVLTPDKKTYKSSFEEMLPSPPVDSIYYYKEHHETAKVGEYVDGLQFYIDFNATSYFGKYYRWIVEETYEYHSTWPITTYYDPTGQDHSYLTDISRFVCYKTEKVDDINLLTTEGLTQNKYIKAKLHFVDDHSQRLMFNYSILVKQLSLSKQAYLYWSNMKKNNQETAGLFSKQPAMPKGNLYNENDSTEEVLGYFSVSSETSKRIIVEKVTDMEFSDVGFCDANVLNGPLPKKLIFFVEFLSSDGTTQKGYTFQECVDCTMHGGVLDKPTFFK